MLPRFNKTDLRIIAHYLGILIMLFGLIMLAPLIVSIIYAEWDIMTHYVLGIGISLTVGTLLRLAKIDPQRMNRKHAIAITGTVWIFGAVLAAVPLFLSGHYATFLDAVFEGVSGLTATGLSLVQDVDHLSMADNMWRFTMQFVGGQGVIVVAISLGLFTRTGNTLYTSEGREESVVPNVMNTARFIWKFAIAAVLVGTIVMSVILFLKGMDPGRGFFHALWITIGAYDTGGFGPGSLSLMAYHSWALEIVALLLMMFGALNFAMVAQIHKGNWREFLRDIEVRTLALWTAGLVALFVAVMASGEYLTDYSGMMRRGVFTIISATTNTGFQVLTTEQITTLLSSGALLLVAMAMSMGGSSASTAGGIKALRVGLIFKGIGLQVRRILQPRSAQITTHYNHIGKHQLAPELLSAAMIIAALYVLSYLIGALAGILYGYEALEATFESISAASNAGLSSGVIQPGMPVPLEVLYIVQMWLGRLEFITLLGLIATFFVSILPGRKPRVETISVHDYAAEESSSSSENNEVSGQDDKQCDEQGPRKGFAQPGLLVLGAVVLSLVLALSLLFAPFKSAYADEDTATSAQQGVTITDLANVSPELDNTRVQFRGEVVGDILQDDASHVWLTMTDGQKAISVQLPAELRDQITTVGSYHYKGTELTLTGEYHLGCSEHDGLSDVHVSKIVSIDQAGSQQIHTVESWPLVAGVVMMLVAGLLTLLYKHLSRKRH